MALLLHNGADVNSRNYCGQVNKFLYFGKDYYVRKVKFLYSINDFKSTVV